MTRATFLKGCALWWGCRQVPVQAQDGFFSPKGIRMDREGRYQGPTFLYMVRSGETLADVAERILGDPGQASLLARINNVDSGTQLAAGRRIRVPRPRLSLRYTVYRLAGEDVEVAGRRHRFRSGDRFQIRLSTNLEGYLYLFNRGADGGMTPLFPHAGRKAARVRRFSEYLLPNDGWFQFDAESGTEELFVLVSLEPVERLEQARRGERSAEARRELHGWLDTWFAAASGSKGIVVDSGEDGDSEMVMAPDEGETLTLAHVIRLRR